MLYRFVEKSNNVVYSFCRNFISYNRQKKPLRTITICVTLCIRFSVLFSCNTLGTHTADTCILSLVITIKKKTKQNEENSDLIYK